jgi:hypothetical protein
MTHSLTHSVTQDCYTQGDTHNRQLWHSLHHLLMNSAPNNLHNVRHELHFHTVYHPRWLDFILQFLFILFQCMQNVWFVCYSLSSEFPFERMDNVIREVKFSQHCWTSTSSTVTGLIKGMLKRDPKERIDLNIILTHPWLKVWTVHCYCYC